MDRSVPPSATAVRDTLACATSWSGAENGLAKLALHLRPELFCGGGVYVTDRDDNQWPVENFCAGGLQELEARYGETFDQHSERLFAGYMKVTGMTYEELRRRERY